MNIRPTQLIRHGSFFTAVATSQPQRYIKNMQNARTIVVCGATGQQGACVVLSLLARGGFNVVALSRDPSSTKAAALEHLGVTVRQADLADAASLERIFINAHGVFGVTQPWSNDYRDVDVAAEIAQGRNIIDACQRTNVQHLVLSTAMRIDDEPTGVPHVDSKRDIERYLLVSGVPYTLLRPGTFMDNIGAKFFPVRRGTIQGFTDGDSKLPFVSCHDIGEAAAAVFAAPERWLDKGVNLVSDWVSGDEICTALGKLRNERFRWKTPPKLLMRLFAREFYTMRVKFEQSGRPPYPYHSHINEALRQTHLLVPEFWGIERFLTASGLLERRL